MELDPIGVFHGPGKFPYDCPRQAVLDQREGRIELTPGRGFEEALQDLEGFERIWLVFLFHQNSAWKPKVLPPGRSEKVGVFASRAPYRPNPIGLSCVELLRVEGRCVHLRGTDLIDGTPILDIKPYLPWCDSFPFSETGWWTPLEAWTVVLDPALRPQLDWIREQTGYDLEGFAQTQLQFDPADGGRKRIRPLDDGFEIAYRTWRLGYQLDEADRHVEVRSVYSGYSAEDLASSEDPWEDKAIHRAFSAGV